MNVLCGVATATQRNGCFPSPQGVSSCPRNIGLCPAAQAATHLIYALRALPLPGCYIKGTPATRVLHVLNRQNALETHHFAAYVGS